MKKTIYALLVGIDNYAPGTVSNLRGCKRDVKAFDSYLRGRIREENHRYKKRMLTDSDATRQGIVDMFRSHLSRAGEGDQVIFYFSGHGAQTVVPDELKYLEPDGMTEGLVCYDSRDKDNKALRADLADKELSFLIHEVAEKGPDITIILDCCHSGTATRTEVTGIRRAPVDKRVRPLDSYLFMEDEAMLAKIAELNGEETGRLRLPKGDHILIAACRADQYAQEVEINKVPKGIFSYFLLDSLSNAGPKLTYRDLYMRVNALVKSRVPHQEPQLETTDPATLARPFLGGAIQSIPEHFTASWDKELKRWVVDAGEIHGISPPVKGETTHLALFPYDAPPNHLTDLDKSIQTASIVKVMPTKSQIQCKELDDLTTYKAVITSLPVKPLLVKFDGWKVPTAMVRSELATARPGLKGASGSRLASLLVHEAEADAEALFVLEGKDDFVIRRLGDPDTHASRIGGADRKKARTAIACLEHIARWYNILNLKQTANSLNPDSVKLRIEVEGQDGGWEPVAGEIQLNYIAPEYPEGEWTQPLFRIALKNDSNRRLFCMLFGLSEKYEITSLTGSDGTWLGPGEELIMNDSEPIVAEVPDDFWEHGRFMSRDTLKLIVTTEESYALRFEQGELPLQIRNTRGNDEWGEEVEQPDTLSRFMHQTNKRGLKPKSKAKKVSQWYAKEVAVTTIRPAEAVRITEDEEWE